MDNEILKIVELVKDKTDKELTVVSAGETDETVGYTRFRRGGRDYLCRVEGDCDEGLKNLIVSLLENVSIGEAPLGKDAALKSIVTGDANEITVQKYMRKYGVHDLPCAVFVVHTVDGKITGRTRLSGQFQDQSMRLLRYNRRNELRVRPFSGRNKHRKRI